MNGTSALFLVNKNRGQTSFEALYPIKRLVGTSRVGHSGTLDSFASGLLWVATASYTRLLPWAVALDKSYEADFLFGKTTPTLDPHSPVSEHSHVPNWEDLVSIRSSFLGEISQRPPLFSAVHHQGKRAYQRALEGEEFSLRERLVHIRSLEFVSYENATLRIKLNCSKGTYVRSLARDIAECLGTCAYVTSLTRTGLGPWSLDEASSLESLTLQDSLPLEKVLRDLAWPFLEIPEEFSLHIKQGKPLNFLEELCPHREDGFYALSTSLRILALLEKKNQTWTYRQVFFA